MRLAVGWRCLLSNYVIGKVNDGLILVTTKKSKGNDRIESMRPKVGLDNEATNLNTW